MRAWFTGRSGGGAPGGLVALACAGSALAAVFAFPGAGEVVRAARDATPPALAAVLVAPGRGQAQAVRAAADPGQEPSPSGEGRDGRPPFEVWLAGVREDALARGISARTVSAALDGLEPLAVAIERDRAQPEFTLSLEAYLRRRVTPAIVRDARARLARHERLLRRIQARYGVDPAVLVAIWGLESNFGRFSGVRPTVATLATLAYEPRRAAFFRRELLDALEILDRGEVDAGRLRGSWAGAMGQPQFMPSSYLEHAVDFDGDGRRDIWGSTADVLASMANYLAAHGWQPGERWGREVEVPRAVAEGMPARALAERACPARLALSEPAALAEWQRLGVRLPGGRALPRGHLRASLVQVDGRSLLVYRNYEAILGYNCSHRYAVSVVTLADRAARR
jgi:membrane-bound lytic murein transglycosylase B